MGTLRSIDILTKRAWIVVVVLVGCEPQAGGDARTTVPVPDDRSVVRVALFNIRELSTDKLTDVDGRGVGRDAQARAAATIIQQVSPDVLVLNEIDHDYEAAESGLDLNARRFAEAYLAHGSRPVRYPFSYAAPNNTGILSGIDLDGDGWVATRADRGEQVYGNDSYGFGLYPGQYSMAILSRYPIAAEAARTFARFLWRDLDGNHIPEGFYSDEALAVFRLSSKSHWDVPVRVGESVLHLLVSHPTPPVFDGVEDRNGRRNFDEIGFWARYLDDGTELRDDEGVGGGYGSDDPFVIVGDLNARPNADESLYEGRTAISQLLEHPRVQDSGPFLTSEGALRGREPGRPDHWERATTGFGGGSRIDYLLPSTGIEIIGGGVYWPDAEADPEGKRLADQASDHRLVWIDLRLTAPESRP
jgi:endonuclease/exonuclease/phosphatase family metal-dependent hydrolase